MLVGVQMFTFHVVNKTLELNKQSNPKMYKIAKENVREFCPFEIAMNYSG